MQERFEISDKQSDEVISKLFEMIDYQTKSKGKGEFVSTHEILGVVTEEWKELTDATQSNNFHNVREELMDIAVAAVWGIASINNWIDRIGSKGRRELERISQG